MIWVSYDYNFSRYVYLYTIAPYLIIYSAITFYLVALNPKRQTFKLKNILSNLYY